ncbi:MAG TPA: sugar ABC transporter permease [Tepidisphaeraceae bacterium]|nr:sugar ABC transporter permease [Tepidisphaeraceae bacterium]
MTARLWRLQHRLAPYAFVLPFVALFGAFLFYPLGRSLVLSAYQTAGPRQARFVGLANYRFLLGDRLFWWAVANTLLFTIAYVAIQVPAALGLAMLLDRPRLLARAVLRFSFFAAYLVGSVFVAVLFAQLLAPRGGPVNTVLGWVVGGDVTINWLGDRRLAMASVLIASLWLSIGYGMVYCLAALQSVDRALYDAAAVDGAGRWARFRHVTLPGVRPVLGVLALVGTVGALQLFELPYVLFAGPGPNLSALTIVMYLFGHGFEQGDLGYASAAGWVLVLITAVVAIVLLRLARTEEP